MSAQFAGKVALVTGSSSGLGRAIALKFASHGANVIICGRDPTKIQAVYEEAVKVSGGHQGRFMTSQGDVTNSRYRQELVAKTISRFGRLDILVPNAGVALKGTSLREADEAVFDKVMDTNVKSVFFLIQEALPHLEKTRGCVVNISSILSQVVIDDAPIYPMSKAAVDHMTRNLANDLGSKGIRVNCVNPSLIRTHVFRDLADDQDTFNTSLAQLEMPKQIISSRLGTPEEIAETVAFLASDAASFVTGQIINVDGGRVARGGIYTFQSIAQ